MILFLKTCVLPFLCYFVIDDVVGCFTRLIVLGLEVSGLMLTRFPLLFLFFNKFLFFRVDVMEIGFKLLAAIIIDVFSIYSLHS